MPAQSRVSMAGFQEDEADGGWPALPSRVRGQGHTPCGGGHSIRAAQTTRTPGTTSTLSFSIKIFLFFNCFPIPQFYYCIFHHVFPGNTALIQKSSWFFLVLLQVLINCHIKLAEFSLTLRVTINRPVNIHIQSLRS